MTVMTRIPIALAIALAIAVFAVGPVRPAHADKETSVQLHQLGKRKYELAEYDKAIALFRQAYDEHPFPALQYNIAQAYLKLGKCSESLTHFRSFLAEKPDAPNRAAVEAQIAELEGQCGPDLVKKPPAPVPAEPTPVAVREPEPLPPKTTPPTASTAVKTVAPIETRRRMLAASADVGIAFYNIGDVVVPVTPALRLAAAVPLEVFGLALEPYGAIELQTMAYDHAEDSSSTVLFSTLMGGATVMAPVVDRIRAGGDLGLGIFHFSGLKMGNPFVAAGAEQNEAVNTFALRLALAAEYELNSQLAAAFAPAIVIASGDDSLRDEIGSISRVELMIGIRYRL